MGKNADRQKFLEEQARQDRSVAYQTRFIQVRHDTIHYDNRSPHNWDVVVHPGGVAVVALDSQNRFVLVEQWRHAIDRITLELPAGLIDPGESLESCAQRELQEEAGFKAGSLHYLGAYYPSPGVLTEIVHLFQATQLTPSQLHADDTDGIDIRLVPSHEAVAMIHNGTINDAKTALGILRCLA